MAVTGVTIAATVALAVTSPAALSVNLDANGWVWQIATDTTATAFDFSKVSAVVIDQGFDPDRTVQDRIRNLSGIAELVKPYNNDTDRSQVSFPGKADIVMSDEVFLGAAGTQIFSLVFEAGFTPGSARQVFDVSTIVRNDNRPYPKMCIRFQSPPKQVTHSDSDPLEIEMNIIDRWARNNSQVACVEGFMWQTGGAVGPSGYALGMSRSVWTPVGDTHPGGIPAQCYRVPISGNGLTDGAAEIRVKAYPWIGPVYETGVEGVAYGNWDHPTGWPVVRDYANAHTPIYAFINDNGTAGASPALQSTLTDPGSAASYATFATAATAIRTFNAARGHDDLSGGVIVMRDVAGSAMGSATGSYAWRTSTSSTSSFPPGLIPIEIRTLSGLPSVQARLTSMLQDGTTASPSKQTFNKAIWRGVTFDTSYVTTNANNQIFDGQGAGLSATFNSAAYEQIHIDTYIKEWSGAASSSPYWFRQGIFHHFRVRHENVSGAGAIGSVLTAWCAGLMTSVGSSYSVATEGVGITPCTLNGVRMSNIALRDQALFVSGVKQVRPIFNNSVVMNVRIDKLNPATTGIQILMGAPRKRFGMCNVMYRKVGTGSGPAGQLGADGSFYSYDDVVIQHVGVYGERWNDSYQDQGWVTIVKRRIMFGCAFHNYNLKSSSFPATETPANTAGATAQYSSSVSYPVGALIWTNGTATAPGATSVIYQVLQDAPAGTPLSDTAYFENHGTTYNVAFGAQSKRLGNWFSSYGVGSSNNFAAATVSGGGGPNDWYGKRFPGLKDAVPITNWVVRDTSAKGSDTWADDGDFRPKTGVSPMLNQVAVGAAVCLYDLAGQIRKNNGQGAAGPYEITSLDITQPRIQNIAVAYPFTVTTPPPVTTQTVTLPRIDS